MKKKHEDHVNHERWLVSYADFITLLFAFFVVMFALAQNDKAAYERKLKAAAQSIRQAFEAPFFGPPGGTAIGPATGGAAGEGAKSAPETGFPGGDAVMRDQVKAELEESLTLDLGVAGAADTGVRVLQDSRGTVIRLSLKDFFPAGRAEVPRDLWPLLDRLGRILVKHARPVRVEGHADAAEVTGGYPSAWELSAARAAWVVRYWVNRFSLNPARIEVVGQGTAHPLATGDEDWAHARNRRIEIVILK